MADCPVCPSAKLVATQVSENLSGLGCTHCEGLLLGLVNYRIWRESHALKVGSQNKVQAKSTSANTRIACRCPKCGSIMTKYYFSEEMNAQLDFCYHCEEIWFDQGEWALLEDLSLADELTQIFTHPWQHSLLERKISNMQSERWRKTFGNDFEKIEKTTKWIQTHPHKSQILAYIVNAIRQD